MGIKPFFIKFYKEILMFEQEKSYSLRFLESNPEIDYGQEWN